MRTLLIAVLLVFPIFGGAAEDWPLSNWLWELPPERQTFSGLLTGENFRKVIRELETRRSVDFMALRPLDGRHAFVHPVGQIGDPPRHSKGVEAAEILNGLRMDRYRERCEKLKNITLQGTPSVYPTEMPFLEDR